MRRPHRIGALALLALSGALAAAALGGDARLEVTLDPPRLFRGDSALLTVDALDFESPGDPVLDVPDGIAVDRVGDASLNQSSITIVNGELTREERLGHRFQFRLTPSRAGSFDLPPVTLAHDGRILESQKLHLEVVGPTRQDLAIIVSDVKRTGRYPLQPFTVRVRVFVRKLPAPYADQDPLSPLDVPPKLNIAWLQAPDGLESAGFDSWLTPKIMRRRDAGGFRINELQQNDIFSGRRALVFDLGGRPAQPADVEGAGETLAGRAADYYVYAIERDFTPQRAGRFEFAPVTIQGDVVVDVKNRRPKTQGIFDEGGGLAVDVEEAPREGRPRSFAGAYGSRFSLSADVQPRRARVGDPLALTVALKGTGNVEEAEPMDLAADPAIAAAFAIEKPQAETKDGARLFTWSLRPKSKSVKEVPALELSYFDVDKSRYETVKTEPIPVEVEQIESLGAGDIVSGGVPQPRRDGELQRAQGLFGNITDPAQARDRRVDWRRTVVGIPALGALWLALAGGVALLRKRRSDPFLARRRGAARIARERLDRVAALLASGDRAQAAGELSAAFAGVVAAAARVEESALTPREVEARLAQLGVSREAAAPALAVLAECEAWRYEREGTSASPAGSDSIVARARAALDGVIAALGRWLR